MNSGPLSARSAPWARAARARISTTSAAPIRRSTRKAKCWRVNSAITLQTLKARPLQSESNWALCVAALQVLAAPEAAEHVVPDGDALTAGPGPGPLVAPPAVGVGEGVHPLAHALVIAPGAGPARGAATPVR